MHIDVHRYRDVQIDVHRDVYIYRLILTSARNIDGFQPSIDVIVSSTVREVLYYCNVSAKHGQR